jgi:hypothetical protein
MVIYSQTGAESGESQNNSAGFWGIRDIWDDRRGKRGLKWGWIGVSHYPSYRECGYKLPDGVGASPLLFPFFIGRCGLVGLCKSIVTPATLFSGTKLPADLCQSSNELFFQDHLYDLSHQYLQTQARSPILGTAWCKDYGRSGRGFSTRRKGYRWSPIGTVARTTRYQREGSC